MAGKVKKTTVTLNERTWTLDLGADSLAQLEKALQPFVANGAMVAKVSRISAGKRSPADLAAIRKWARGKGYKVSDKGRIPAKVMDAYKAANG